MYLSGVGSIWVGGVSGARVKLVAGAKSSRSSGGVLSGVFGARVESDSDESEGDSTN